MFSQEIWLMSYSLADIAEIFALFDQRRGQKDK